MKVEFLHSRLSFNTRFILAFLFYVFAALLQMFVKKGGSPDPLLFRAAALGLILVSLWFLKVKNYSSEPKSRPDSDDPQSKKKPNRIKNIISALFFAVFVLLIFFGSFKFWVLYALIVVLTVITFNLKNKKSSKKPEINGAPSGIWKPAAIADLNRFRNRIKSAEKIKVPKFYSPVFGVVITFFLIFPSFLGVVMLMVLGDTLSVNYEPWPIFTPLYLYLLFFPVLWYARVVKWTPPISNKIGAFDPVLEAVPPRNFKLDAMLLFDDSQIIPSDMRLMLAPAQNASQELRDELIGAQFQAAINSGSSGSVPYMYAVFITKGQGKIWQALSNVKHDKYITEPGSSSEGDVVYGTVVIRLDTKSRSDGYHTKKNDVDKLIAIVAEELEKL